MKPPPDQSGYLSLKGLALYSSSSVRWLRLRLHDRRHPLPHYRVNGKLLVRVEEFDRWMAQYHISPEPDELDQIVNDVVAQVGSQRPS